MRYVFPIIAFVFGVSGFAFLLAGDYWMGVTFIVLAVAAIAISRIIE